MPSFQNQQKQIFVGKHFAHKIALSRPRFMTKIKPILLTFSHVIVKKTTFHVAVRLVSNGSGRIRQNVVRTSVTHSATSRVPLFCSYHILTSSVIYLRNGKREVARPEAIAESNSSFLSASQTSQVHP